MTAIAPATEVCKVVTLQYNTLCGAKMALVRQFVCELCEKPEPPHLRPFSLPDEQRLALGRSLHVRRFASPSHAEMRCLSTRLGVVCAASWGVTAQNKTK